MADLPLSPQRAALRWLVYVLLFNLAGGLAAGTLALVFLLAGSAIPQVLYAAVYVVTGYMAYQQAREVHERRG